MVFRDDNVVVIETGSLITRALVGLAESMTPPQVRVPTKVGVKKSGSASPEYLFGDDLEEAIRQKDQDVEAIQPIVQGVIKHWDAIEIFWYLHGSWRYILTPGGGCCLRS